MTKLENLQQEYLELLTDEYNKILPMATVHGYTCPQEIVDRGQQLSVEIEKELDG
jgi:hypothetical protein